MVYASRARSITNWCCRSLSGALTALRTALYKTPQLALCAGVHIAHPRDYRVGLVIEIQAVRDEFLDLDFRGRSIEGPAAAGTPTFASIVSAGFGRTSAFRAPVASAGPRPASLATGSRTTIFSRRTILTGCAATGSAPAALAFALRSLLLRGVLLRSVLLRSILLRGLRLRRFGRRGLRFRSFRYGLCRRDWCCYRLFLLVLFLLVHAISLCLGG